MVSRAIKARGQVTLTKLYDGTNGTDGKNGSDGAVGTPGADGKTTYVHVAYSSSADGKTNFSITDPTGRSYIGVLTDFTEKDSTNYSDYTWSLVKGKDGEDGAEGMPGKPGADGKTPYVHFAYANSADGKTDFSITVYANKKFIGTLTDYTVADSTDYTKYTWSRLKGESGVGIANTVVEYQITDTQDQPSDDSGWTSSIPNLAIGSYLWTRTTFFYTDGTTSRAYTISKQSDNTYTAVLTNDSITLPSDSNGKVTDFSNSTGNFLVYDGTYQVDSTTIKIQLVQAVNVTVTLGGNAYTITAMDSSKDTGYFDLSYTYKGVALTKRVSVSKSKSGANGTTPVIVNLSANAQVFTFDSNNHANPTSQNILFKTTVSGTTNTPVYKAIPYDESGNAGAEIVMSNSGTNGKMLQVSQLNDYVSILVTASIGSVSDSTTIVRVKDGSSISPIPDPSNTVSSNTPPTDAKDGDWWNDTSQTPNVLKYRYRDKWVQYELDGYYVKANSISGEAIVTNTLEAQKIKYTNSNGTTTNLQTFDFSGMKTLLTDTKGNTYDSMDNAVSSTQSWTSLSKQVNNLGQVNQLFNTEFTPDFSGWFSGLSVGSGGKYTDGNLLSQDATYSLSSEKRNGSNVINKTYGSGVTSFHSGLIPVSSGVTTAVAIEMKSSWDYNGNVTGAVYLRYYDVNLNYVSENDLNSARMVTWNRFYHKSVAPDNATYVVLNIVTNGNKGITSYSQPMMVFSDSIGSYVPGNYNNNARVLAIEKSASQFQVKISGDVSTAQSAADSANDAINNLSVGGRNLLLGTRDWTDNTRWNQRNTVTTDTYRGMVIAASGGAWTSPTYSMRYANILQVGKTYTFSTYVRNTSDTDTKVAPYYEGGIVTPIGTTTSLPAHTDWIRVSITFQCVKDPTTSTANLRWEGKNALTNGQIQFAGYKLEEGNTPTDWTPAPEDVSANISGAVNNISVGGRNYVLNSSGLNGSSTVRPTLSGTTSGANVTVTYPSDGILMTNGATNTTTEWYYQVANAWAKFSDTPLNPGEPITFSADVMGTVPQAVLRYGFNGGTDGKGGKEIFKAFDINNTSWTRVSMTVTSDSTNTGLFFRIQGGKNNQYVTGWYGGETLKFRYVKIEKGNKATDWTPAPEDVQTGITNAQTSADTANRNLANASQSGIRYLRFRGEGNTDNVSVHISEIKVLNAVNTNVVKGKTALLVNGATNYQNASNATDENYSTYIDLGDMRNSEKYVMFDLGMVRYDVNSVQISMWTSNRTYYGVVAQTSPDGISWSTIYRGNITPSQLIGGVVSTVVSFGMDTSTVLKLTADNYTMGIDANGNLVSGISGNKQQVTLKGNVIHLDGNTVMDQNFFSLWNGQYGSTKIDSTGMEVTTGLAKTKFTNGNMQLISSLGENIGYIGRQVDSVHTNLDYLTFGLNGYRTTRPGDSHYDGGDDFYGGDGILFGISNADGGYSPLLQWNSQLAANYRSAKSGWLFTQPIIGETTFYPNDMSSDYDGLILKHMTIDGISYPTYSSTSSQGSAGLAVGVGTSNLYAGTKRVLQANSNGYMYYLTGKTTGAGVNLKIVSDGAIAAQSSATKYKSDIEYEYDTSHGDKLLTIDPATWSDSVQKEQIEEYNKTGKEPDYAMNKDGDRYYGLIAEDLVKAGLEDLVVRDANTGSVEGIQYEKIGIALIPILREQRNQINELRVEIERLKEKNNE